MKPQWSSRSVLQDQHNERKQCGQHTDHAKRCGLCTEGRDPAEGRTQPTQHEEPVVSQPRHAVRLRYIACLGAIAPYGVGPPLQGGDYPALRALDPALIDRAALSALNP